MKTGSILIRFAIGLNMLVFGVHQLMNPSYWYVYVPHFVSSLLPVPEVVFMRIHASANIVLGLLTVFGIWKKYLSWIDLLWWGSIIPFAFMHQWDIGIRDVVVSIMIVAYISLLRDDEKTMSKN